MAGVPHAPAPPGIRATSASHSGPYRRSCQMAVGTAGRAINRSALAPMLPVAAHRPARRAPARRQPPRLGETEPLREHLCRLVGLIRLVPELVMQRRNVRAVHGHDGKCNSSVACVSIAGPDGLPRDPTGSPMVMRTLRRRASRVPAWKRPGPRTPCPVRSITGAMPGTRTCRSPTDDHWCGDPVFSDLLKQAFTEII